ncbi:MULTISPECIES: metallophosphoesterase family protein [Amycolatopsis]|uniref:Serine/threonine protein phosphatase n=1 Tax=Amycolatopsis dendrobii TaxID=2760662 RepID=A0A7W3W751_9PSEU|nr:MULTISPECIES: metallophosphoesterase family protein [Amycolatopsis]MBB1160089.1 serine/threonine protein phosphatase [Amycolatopsis dendrobii]UKD52488.1 serine/threonine protein phosphatase [Amycolatopsis sp. FU40]
MSVYVVGDVHGHRDALVDALRAEGLVDSDGKWAGVDDRLWFLGDFTDRGPDGVGVIDLVRELQEQAAESGGSVQMLLGNHEILLLGMYHFGDRPVPSDFGPRSFARSWEINGGLLSDQDRLTPEHIEWLTERPLVAVDEDHLLLHSDTLEYLDWGEDLDSINATAHDILSGSNIEAWWDVWRRMTTRYAFRGPDGEENAERLLKTLGGSRIVHGHSVIADQLGIHPTQIEGPYLYAGGKALGIDGGLFVGGPCLVVKLPFEPED